MVKAQLGGPVTLTLGIGLRRQRADPRPHAASFVRGKSLAAIVLGGSHALDKRLRRDITREG